MEAVVDNFDLAIRLSAVIIILTALLAWRAASKPGTIERSRKVLIARHMTIGSALVAVVATSIRGPRLIFESGGDLVLTLGGGGLGDLKQIAASPSSLAAILLAGNILLYVPIGFAGTFGWYDRRRSVLVGCLLLSIAVETLQMLALGRVAALDDVILNMTGATIGYGLASLMVRYDPSG